MSESSTVDVNIDNIAPMEPSITLSKPEGLGDGIWYGKDGGTVTITAGSDTLSGPWKIRYKVEGATTITEREQEGTSITIKITNPGESKITAYTIDKAGNVSEIAAEETAKVDTGAPKATIEEVSRGGHTIRVRAGYEDDASGVYTYILWYRTKSTGSTWAEAGRVTVPNGENPFEFDYTGLKKNTEFYLKVTAIDRAGNQEDSNEILSATTPLAEVGDYVAYTPDQGTYDIIAGKATYTGNTSNPTFKTDTFSWRIWDTGEKTGQLILIADGVTSQKLYLTGALGYNNGVRNNERHM